MWTVTQAAEALDLSRARVHQLISAGRIKADKLGSIVLVKSLRVKPGKRNGRPRKA
jgi:excisionase family DNA binding protein